MCSLPFLINRCQLHEELEFSAFSGDVKSWCMSTSVSEIVIYLFWFLALGLPKMYRVTVRNREGDFGAKYSARRHTWNLARTTNEILCRRMPDVKVSTRGSKFVINVIKSRITARQIEISLQLLVVVQQS